MSASDPRGGAQAAGKVVVTLGEAYRRKEAMIVPLSWRASALPAMFPVLDGELEVTPVDPRRCRLTLTASYVPPFGELGRQLDRALLRRVARSTARAFLEQVAVGLEENSGVQDLRPGWS